MKCKYCQAELEDGVTVCPVCGKEQGETPAEEVIPAAEETPVQETAPVQESAPVRQPAPEMKEGIKATPGKIALAVVAGVVVLAVLVAVIVAGLSSGKTESLTSTEASTEAASDTVEATEGTIPPDGNPDDVTCKGSYTASDEEVIAAADTVVATMGGKELTLSQLQVYYWVEVYDFLNSYGDYSIYFGLDYTQPLDTQTCDLDETSMTWQQYFLSCAIDSWRSYQALALEGEANGVQLDEEFQSYLDTLPEDMEELAVSYGFESTEALLEANYGPAATMDDYAHYLNVYYNGYNYFSDVYDKTVPTAEEVEAYFAENEEAYAESGVTKDSGKYVDVRHILILVEGGTTDEDGNTTYSDEEWETCRAEAQQILDQWLEGEATEDSFAALANEYSEDPGSNTTGGLYQDVYVGQMVENFENWCFDESRQAGDYGLVQTEYGYHIMYYVSSQDIWYSTAEDELISETLSALVPAAMEKYPAEVDYSAIKLGFIDLTA